MVKIMVVSIPDHEERVFEGIQKYLLENEKFSVMNPTQSILLEFPGLKIDLETREIWKNTKKIVLTDIEFRLLLFLAKSPGRVFSYQQIYEAVWSEEYVCEKGNIMSLIRHIREKIESDPKTPEYIENVRGVGYRFRKQ